jgi:hypothetical protein
VNRQQKVSSNVSLRIKKYGVHIGFFAQKKIPYKVRKIIQYDKIISKSEDISIGDVHKSQCNNSKGKVPEKLDELNGRQTCLPW